jgi:putative ATP-dependent endonuclease of OLD family
VAIRRLNPLVWLRGGALLAAPAETRNHTDAQIASEISELVDDIERHYGAIISGKSKHPREELEAGFEAARSLLIHEAVDARVATAQPVSVITEILGGASLRKRKRLESLHGSAAQQMGILILTAAILRQASLKTLREARPILVIEDPEAGLHAMTLSSVWGLLERIEAQKIITTQSGMLLSNAPLHQVRRIMREEGEVRQSYVRKNTLRRQDLRKISYHLRIRQGAASFARCWLLVEGETEFWLLPELARSCGYNFDLEGVTCVEFAQCGIEPLIKLARDWGIEWTVLVDGDYSGRQYAETARRFLDVSNDQGRRLIVLEEDNIEECFWKHGYKQVFVDAAKLKPPPSQRLTPKRVIKKAIERFSKPYLAFELIQATSAPGSPGVPDPLGRMIETCVRLARGKDVKKS